MMDAFFLQGDSCLLAVRQIQLQVLNFFVAFPALPAPPHQSLAKCRLN